MKNRNNIFITIVSAVAFALAPIVQAGPAPDGGPHLPSLPPLRSPMRPVWMQNLPMITIHITDNVIRGKTGSFVLDMKPALMSVART